MIWLKQNKTTKGDTFGIAFLFCLSLTDNDKTRS